MLNEMAFPDIRDTKKNCSASTLFAGILSGPLSLAMISQCTTLSFFGIAKKNQAVYSCHVAKLYFMQKGGSWCLKGISTLLESEPHSITNRRLRSLQVVLRLVGLSMQNSFKENIEQLEKRCLEEIQFEKIEPRDSDKPNSSLIHQCTSNDRFSLLNIILLQAFSRPSLTERRTFQDGK
jgi:hypothetical protein